MSTRHARQADPKNKKRQENWPRQAPTIEQTKTVYTKQSSENIPSKVQLRYAKFLELVKEIIQDSEVLLWLEFYIQRRFAPQLSLIQI